MVARSNLYSLTILHGAATEFLLPDCKRASMSHFGVLIGVKSPAVVECRPGSMLANLNAFFAVKCDCAPIVRIVTFSQ